MYLFNSKEENLEAMTSEVRLAEIRDNNFVAKMNLFINLLI